MDINARFGLEFNPFLKNSREILVETKAYQEAVFRLNYLAKTRGFGLLTGGPGKGKTTVIRNWTASLNPSLFSVAYTSLSTLTVQEFYRNLAAELGLQPVYRKSDNFRIIQAEITRLTMEKRRTPPLIVLDEASYISGGVLNDLKLLFNFEMDSRDRAVVLLSGLSQLNTTLRLDIHEPLRQRLVMNYHIEGLSKEEGREYLSAKLRGAGCHQPVFEDAAVEALLNAADGVPRLINKIANAALLAAHAQNLNLVSADTLRACLTTFSRNS